MAEEAMSDTLKDLLARVEAATGPDREIDAELIRIVWREDPTAWIMTNTTIPAYTASLDAIIALVEKMLPSWSWSLNHLDGVYGAHLFPHAGEHDDASMFRTPALALIAALLKALIAHPRSKWWGEETAVSTVLYDRTAKQMREPQP